LSQLEKVAVAEGDLEDSFLTVADVAEMLKLNQQTVRNWIDQGSLPALRVGRRVRIRRSDFNRLVTEGSTRTSDSAATLAGPTADDFWSGEPVGLAEPGPMTDDPGVGSELATESANSLDGRDPPAGTHAGI
jgi:excisionase family DNA binding protein